MRSGRSDAARWGWAAVLAVVASLTAGCAEGPAPSESTGGASNDKLVQVLSRGTLVGYAELEYPPQSIKVDDAVRPSDTRCLPHQMTAAEVTGFDVEMTKLVATALGVEACFVRPSWTEVTAGSWGDRMDLAYGSGSINADRMVRLYMTQPYYAVPNHFFVREDSSVLDPRDLSGRRIGVCASCSHEYYLKRELEIPGVVLEYDVQDPEIVAFETEGPGLQALADGEIDAFLAAAPVGQARIAEGLPLRALDQPAFTYYPTGFVDRNSSLRVTAFVDRVNEIVRNLHADGTLRELSMEWFGADYASAAGEFDLDAIGQTVP